ncbi:MAG: orotidine-5'-phosphate decarboxylase [bacterium]
MNAEQAEKLRKHVIVALDLDTMDDALQLVDRLFPTVDKFKVGSRMFTAFGPALLDAIAKRGASVFLDLKFHDIPSVVQAACASAAQHPSVFLMTIHALGGPRMIAQASEGAGQTGSAKVIAVTALTSHSGTDVHALGVRDSLEDWVERLAVMATEAGAHGLVCSPHELERLKPIVPQNCIFVTPGIRTTDAAADDQTRVMTAAQAIERGSTYLVIGRPVYGAADPVHALEAIGATL